MSTPEITNKVRNGNTATLRKTSCGRSKETSDVAEFYEQPSVCFVFRGR